MGARLEKLDRMLAMALRMAFILARFTSTEGSLVLGGLSPAYGCTSCAPLFVIYSGTGRAELIRDLPSSVHRLLRDSGGDWSSLVSPGSFGTLFGGPAIVASAAGLGPY